MGDSADLIASVFTEGLSEVAGRPGFIRKAGGALIKGPEEEKKKKKRRPAAANRGRSSSGRGRGAANLTTGQQLGIANVGLKRLTGA